MPPAIKFRIQAGALLFEIEGPRAFVQMQMERHRDQIGAVLAEQRKIIESGRHSAAARPMAPAKRRGRPPRNAAAKPAAGAPRGRQPKIVRTSDLQLTGAQVESLRAFLKSSSKGIKLGKDATVFAVAYWLSKNVNNSDRFSAGDVSAALDAAGSLPFMPSPRRIDIVQMLRNLSASSIGKMWVARNDNGTFALTAKGKAAAAAGKIVRPRGRKPAEAPAPGEGTGRKRGRPKGSGAAAPAKARRGRPPKIRPAAETPKRRPGRPPKTQSPTAAAKRGPGRPRKVQPVAAVPKRRPGRPPKIRTATEGPKRGPGRPPKIQQSAAMPKRRPGRPPKIQSAAPPVRRGPGRPRKNP